MPDPPARPRPRPTPRPTPKAKPPSPPEAERLAIPAWQAPPRSLADWAGAIGVEGWSQDPDGSAYVEDAAGGIAAFALTEGGRVVAVDFEFRGPDPAAAIARIERAAASLGWEVHDEPEGDD